MTIATINPATGELLKSFEPLSREGVEEKLRLTAVAFRAHRRTSFAARARALLRVAELLEGGKEIHSRLITTEMGKTLRAAAQEIEKSARLCRHYASEAEGVLSEEYVQTRARGSC